MIRLLRHMRLRDVLLTLLSLGFTLLRTYFELRLPDFMSNVTTLVQTPGSPMDDVLRAGGNMLLCALGAFLSAVMIAGLSSRIAANFSMGLREKQFERVSSFSMEEMSRFSTASLITRSTNDITQIQHYVGMGIRMLFRAPITAIWAVTKIARKGEAWSIATGVALVIMFAMLAVVFGLAMPRFKRVPKLTDAINRIARENLTGIRVVRAYNAEWYQEGKFEDANKALTKNNLLAHRIMRIQGPSMGLIMNGLSVSIYAIGAVLIMRSAVPDRLPIFSDMIVFMRYAVHVVMSFMVLTMFFVMAPRAAISANRINEVLDTEPSIRDGEEAPEHLMGAIEFRNVSFRYPDANECVLKDISFRIAPGETVAFIGATGSGKSTLLNLVPRFYDPTEGQVLIDGKDVRSYTLHSLRDAMGYVPQTAFLFSGTIADNIDYGDRTTDVTLHHAASNAEIASYIENLPEGYDAPVARGGTNYSGGQKQRISIARAIHRAPSIYLFDDSFSALDYATERRVRRSLERETAEATTLIVAQRIGTVRDADRIIVLDEGRVVGNGRHDELLKTCSVYREIALSQLSLEELD
ncbi:MAG: ABC transporter ATP-binding protein [Saccharofermentanales bacterium]|jgi:ATP-binding cassette subfamily B multidrug efflux pump